MHLLHRTLLASLLLTVSAFAAHADIRPADPALIEAFQKNDQFNDIKISPDGTYFAVTVPLEDRTVLAMMRRSDRKTMGVFNLQGKSHVRGFWWVSDTRLVLSVAQRDGTLEAPGATGELFATDVDGGNQTILSGYRSGQQQAGTHLQTRDDPFVWTEFAGLIPGDEKNILVAATRINDDGTLGATSLDQLDVRSGIRRKRVGSQLVLAEFGLDHANEARFVQGETKAGFHQLYVRDKTSTEWRLLNDEASSNRREFFVGFDEADKTAYLDVQEKQGPDGLYAYDMASGARTLLARDKRYDPERVHYRNDGVTPYAVAYPDGKSHLFFFEHESAESKLLQSLAEKSFPDATVEPLSRTRDGRLVVFRVASDVDPGSFYLLDTQTKKADLLLPSMQWLNSEALASVKPVEFKARDGMIIAGLLTLPKSQTGPAPMIVLPHGGPYEIADSWGFDREAQMLAAHGYAVLQPNFRGSGQRGRDFVLAGRGQWGATMQDDITDATQWAIAQGYADAGRICIYGGSYGAYAALMGAAREPALYRCAVGYAGVYDLPSWIRQSDVRNTDAGMNYIRSMIGTDNALLSARSPASMADRIRIPVFLASGGKDVRTPQKQSELMRDRLTAAGNAPKWLDFPTEGHGFYALDHRLAFYKQLLDFFYANLHDAKPVAH